MSEIPSIFEFEGITRHKPTQKQDADSTREMSAPHSDSRWPARNNIVLMALVILALAYLAFDSAYNSFDNDLWFILASGREILENGVPYINPWSMHADMATVVQQWLPAVIVYGIYSIAGMAGTELWVFILIAVFVFCAYRLGREITANKNRGGEVILVIILLAVLLMRAYMATRPHLYTMIAYTLILLVLERYRRTNNWHTLLWLPLITLVHGNCHMAMAPLDLFIIALYWIPDFLAPIKKRFEGFPAQLANATYRRLPILIALAVCAITLLINPYGIDGALYLVNSYGAADYANNINEMQPLTAWSTMGWLYLIFFALDFYALGKMAKRGINLPHVVLFVVMAIMALMHIRNIWLFPLFSLPLLFFAFGTYSWCTEKIRVFRSKAICGVVAICAVAVLALNVLGASDTVLEDDTLDDATCPQYGVVYISTYAQINGLDQSSLRIYNTFNNGGYLEWHRLKVFMDPRPELWEPGITKLDKHYYQEFVDAESKASLSARLLATYTFDFIIVDNGTAMEAVLEETSLYTPVFQGNGYVVWANASLGLPEKTIEEEATPTVRDVVAEELGEDALKPEA